MQSNIDKLNEELNASLETLEANSTAAIERQRIDPEIAEEQAKLRAEYLEKVEPVLKTLPSVTKKLRPLLVRCEKYIKEQEFIRGGVRPEYFQPAVATLKELRMRTQNILAQLQRIPDHIDSGPANGELGNWAAQIRTEMRPAPGLLADIETHHASLVFQITEIKNARRWPTKQTTTIHRAAKPELPPEVKADFNVFEDSPDVN